VLEEPHRYYQFGLLILSGAAVLTSIIWTAVTRDSLSAAAAHLDEAAGLKERVSSGLYCQHGIDDPFASAVVADANRASRGLSIRHHLPLRVPYSANFAIPGVLLAALFFWLFPVIDVSGNQAAREEEKQQQELVDRTKAAVQPVLKREVQRMREQYPDLEKELADFKPLEKATLDKPRDVLSEPIKQINQLRDELEERKNSLNPGQIEEFQKLARRLSARQNDNSLVGDLAKAMSKGDFAAAEQAIEELKAKLSETPQSEAERQQSEDLKKQLDQLCQQLSQAAQEQRSNRQDLASAGLNQQQVQQAIQHLQNNNTQAMQQMLQQQGLTQQQISQMMQQMQQRCGACKQAGALARNLSQAAKATQGQMSQQCQQALSSAAQQLSSMQSVQQQINQLQAAMGDLNNMKNQLSQSCSSCNGTGQKDGKPCSACNGSGTKMGQQPSAAQQPGAQQGRGWGVGNTQLTNAEPPPEQQTAYQTAHVRSAAEAASGTITGTQFVDGEQFKGEATAEFREAAIAAQREVQDAIARDQIPRHYQGSVRKFFDRQVESLPPTAEQPAATDGSGTQP
jgi:hypothetical protein